MNEYSEEEERTIKELKAVIEEGKDAGKKCLGLSNKIKSKVRNNSELEPLISEFQSNLSKTVASLLMFNSMFELILNTKRIKKD